MVMTIQLWKCLPRSVFAELFVYIVTVTLKQLILVFSFCVGCNDQEPSGSNWHPWTWMLRSLGSKPCC